MKQAFQILCLALASAPVCAAAEAYLDKRWAMVTTLLVGTIIGLVVSAITVTALSAAEGSGKP